MEIEASEKEGGTGDGSSYYQSDLYFGGCCWCCWCCGDCGQACRIGKGQGPGCGVIGDVLGRRQSERGRSRQPLLAPCRFPLFFVPPLLALQDSHAGAREENHSWVGAPSFREIVMLI